MNASVPDTGLQLFSLVARDGTLELSLRAVPIARPREHEVVVRVEATPINPSDFGLLFAGADVREATQTGTGADAKIVARVAPAALASLGARLDVPMPVGNEGAGVVVAAGSSADAQALLGKTVAAMGGAMYAQYRVLAADACLVLPAGTTPAQGASAFVNPLTALGMTETMRREGHSALVHTAAASNLGQMLNRICIADGIPLVNVVRKPEQAEILRAIGARYVCDSSAPDFLATLEDACAATGATIAFDAIGGGPIAGQILTCMETALSRDAKEYRRYGSPVHKQVYIYGGLDQRPTEFRRTFGMSWGMGGWLVMTFLQKIEPADAQRLKARVAAEIATTFASAYADEISLSGALDLANVARYAKLETGRKVLINPTL